MNALVPKPPEQTALSYAEIAQLGDAIAKSGLFGIKTKDQAIALMMIAHAEGRHPALAARDYDVIQGKPAKKSEAMMRDFIQAGGKVEWHTLSDTKADATFTHPQTGSVRIDWDMARATTAGFAGKDNWKKFPRSMLRSRVVSEGVRTIWPLATSGMYVPEEAADFTGQTIDHTDEEVPDERDALNDAIPMTKQVPLNKAAAAGMPKGPKVTDKAALYDTTGDDPGGARAFLGKVYAKLNLARSRSEVALIAKLPSVEQATATAPDWVKRDLSEMLSDAHARLPEEPEDEDLPEVEIVNGDKLAGVTCPESRPERLTSLQLVGPSGGARSDRQDAAVDHQEHGY